jgi:hypothetical protein
MKFILPTQHAPKTETQVGELRISPNKRVKIETESMTMYWDSMIIESSGQDWGIVNEWLTFHNIIFGDHISLDWYESQKFNSDKLKEEGICNYLVDYLDISSKVYFPNTYPEALNYNDLYKKYIPQPKENKALVKNYFNSIGNARVISTQRQIRNDSFWKVLILFSIIESILGDTPKCSENIKCNVHGNIYPHNNISPREWIKYRLLEIISDPQRVDEYFLVIWEVRQKIRHQTVHEGIIPESHYIQQDKREITWDWSKTTEEWQTNSTAFSNLNNHLSEIARNLLLNKIFGLNMFPALRPLHSVTIRSN